MKKVLSISIGAPHRDHAVTMTLGGERLSVERRGTNGDLDRAVALYRELDGAVDAFGVGGIDFYLQVGERRYHWREAGRIRAAVKRSKVTDGNGLRGILSRRAVQAAEQHLEREGRSLKGMTALKTTACARYSLASALVEAGCDVTFGDLMFALNLPIPLRDLRSVRRLGAAMLPAVTRVPFRWLYSVGESQAAPPRPRWQEYFRRAQLIAGDFLQIREFMPDDLRGKVVVTNTTTRRDVEDLRERGVHLLVTETPRIEGRSFGSNVLEAMLLAVTDKPQEQVTADELTAALDRFELRPGVEVLNPST